MPATPTAQDVSSVEPNTPPPLAAATATATETVPDTDTVAAANNAYRRESWLLTVAPEAAALQLMLHSDEARVRAFIDDHDLHSSAAYYARIVNGNRLFCLVLAPFESMAAADAARQQLPRALQAQQPWRRPVADIHADIRSINGP